MNRSLISLAAVLFFTWPARADETPEPPLAVDPDSASQPALSTSRKFTTSIVLNLNGDRAIQEPGTEPLGPPRVIESAPEGTGPDPAYFRQSRMERWQNYAVDRSGHFRPLVIYSPSGAYYRETGQPFPWAETRSREWMPYLSNQATMSPSP